MKKMRMGMLLLVCIALSAHAAETIAKPAEEEPVQAGKELTLDSEDNPWLTDAATFEGMRTFGRTLRNFMAIRPEASLEDYQALAATLQQLLEDVKQNGKLEGVVQEQFGIYVSRLEPAIQALAGSDTAESAAVNLEEVFELSRIYWEYFDYHPVETPPPAREREEPEEEAEEVEMPAVENPEM